MVVICSLEVANKYFPPATTENKFSVVAGVEI